MPPPETFLSLSEPAYALIIVMGSYTLAVIGLAYGTKWATQFSQGFGFIGLMVHAEMLHRLIDTPQGQVLEKMPMASFVLFLTLFMSWLVSFWRPLVFVRLLLYPAALISVGLTSFFPSQLPPQAIHDPLALLHIFLSFFGVALVVLSTFQAFSFLLQEAQIKKAQGAWLPHLPPLESQEKWLFQTLLSAFLTLSIGFSAGFLSPVLPDHHGLFWAIVGWIICALLLYARYRFGWRGRPTALGTFACAILLCTAYFGSLTS